MSPLRATCTDFTEILRKLKGGMGVADGCGHEGVWGGALVIQWSVWRAKK